MENPEQVCPCCPRHCDAAQLSCNRGRSHFGLPQEAPPAGGPHGPGGHGGPHGHGGPGGHGPRMMQDPGPDAPTAEQAAYALQNCAHALRHGFDGARLLSPLTEAEQQTLLHLLQKCL